MTSHTDSNAATTSSSRRHLRYGATLPFQTIDPITGSWNEASSLVFSRPINVTAFGEITGDLVESWDVSDDGSTYHLHVRPNVCWHDGVVFTARDLAFTLSLLADASLSEQVKPTIPDVTDIDIVDDTVVLRLARPVAGVIGLLAKAAVVPAHRYDRDAVLAGEITADPIGTGPYRLLDRGDGSASFVAHTDYHFGSASIERLDMVFIREDHDRAAALAANTIDLAQIKPQHAATLADDTAVTVHTMQTRVWRALTFGLQRPHLRDPRVRRALSMAIDRSGVLDAALDGYGRQQYWPLPPTSWASPPETPPMGVELAEELLEQVGWFRDAEGRWNADGEPVHFTFCFLETESFREAATREIVRQLDQFGIAAEMVPISWQFYQDMDRTGLSGSDFDGIVVGWSGGVDPYDNLASRLATHGAYNRDGYTNPELDELLSRAVAAPDRATATELYQSVSRLAFEDSIMAPLANPHYLFAARDGLTGFEEFEVDSFYEFPQYAHLFTWPVDS